MVLRDPAIEAPLVGTASLPLGDSVRVRLVQADVVARKTRFELA